MKKLLGVAKVERAITLGIVYAERVQPSMTFRLSFTCRLLRPLLKPTRFENVLKQRAFRKRFSSVHLRNGETVSF